MESLISFWTWVYVIGLTVFFLLAIVLVPLAARDLWRMFISLGRAGKNQSSDQDSAAASQIQKQP